MSPTRNPPRLPRSLRDRSSWAPAPGTWLSALLIVVAFPPYDLAWLIWVAIAPWLVELRRSRAPWRQGLWLSILMTLGGFHWVGSVLHHFGNLPWALALLGLGLFACVGQPQFVAMAMLRRHLPRGHLVCAALVYAAIDWLAPKLWVDTLGHCLYQARWLRQVADLGGVWPLTALIWLANEWVAEQWLRARESSEPSWWPRLQHALRTAAPLAVALALALAYGAWRSNSIEAITARAPRRVPIAVIQANIGDFDKLAAESGVRGAAEQVLQTFFALTDRALVGPLPSTDAAVRRPELIVWPETAYPSTFRTPVTSEELSRDRMLERFVTDRGVPLAFGGYDREGRQDFNALFVLEPRRGAAQESSSYRKSVLLLFGEYIPGAEQIPWISRWFPQVGNFGRGPGPTRLPIRLSSGEWSVLPVICYEALFSSFGIEGARAGAQAILNITNDSWFGRWGEPQLHLALSAFRSIETRLPQVRSTNTGISALILPSGEITERSPLFEPATLRLEVPVLEPMAPTWAVRLGVWSGVLLVLAALASAGLAWRRARTSP